MLTSWRISSAYRKPHTCWQHHAGLTGGVTYSEPARTTTRRIPRVLVAGRLVVIAAIAAALGYPLLASSSSTAASPIVVLRSVHRGALGEYGLCQIYRNESWHFELRPDAIENGCPSMYADPTHDPRMQQ